MHRMRRLSFPGEYHVVKDVVRFLADFPMESVLIVKPF